MTLKSSMLVELLIQPPTGASSDFLPGFFYMTRFIRNDGYPIAAVALRTGSNGEGTVTLALISDEDGTPKEVLFKTELGFPQSKDPDVAATLIAALPKPHYGDGPFWIGFGFSGPCTIPTRLPVFHGRQSSSQLSCATLGDSVANLALEPEEFAEKRGMPFVFPIFQGEG